MVLEALKEKRRRQDGGGSGAAIKLTLGKKKKGSPVINGINACLVVDLPGSGWLLSADYSLAISVASWCCCPV